MFNPDFLNVFIFHLNNNAILTSIDKSRVRSAWILLVLMKTTYVFTFMKKCSQIDKFAYHRVGEVRKTYFCVCIKNYEFVSLLETHATKRDMKWKMIRHARITLIRFCQLDVSVLSLITLYLRVEWHAYFTIPVIIELEVRFLEKSFIQYYATEDGTLKYWI